MGNFTKRMKKGGLLGDIPQKLKETSQLQFNIFRTILLSRVQSE